MITYNNNRWYLDHKSISSLTMVFPMLPFELNPIVTFCYYGDGELNLVGTGFITLGSTNTNKFKDIKELLERYK